MDMNTTDVFNGTMEFFSDLVSTLGLKYREDILDIGPDFKNISLQMGIAQSFYLIFILRKLPKMWIALLTLPMIIFFILPAIAVGKYLPIVTLLCWWIIVQCVPETMALIMLLIFITLFTVSEIAVAIFVMSSYCVLANLGFFSLEDDTLRLDAFLYLLIAMTIGIVCMFHAFMNEIFAMPIIIGMFYQTALIYLPDLANWYLYIAGSAYVVNLILHFYNYLIVEPWVGPIYQNFTPKFSNLQP